jgi:hypothetical protein
VVPPDDVLAGRRVLVFPTAIHREIPQVAIQHRQRPGSVVEEELQPLLAGLHGLLGAMALGDVLREGLDGDDPARVVADGDVRPAMHPLRPVGSDTGVIEADGRPVWWNAAQESAETVAVRRRYEIEQARADQGGRGPAEVVGVGLVDELDHAGGCAPANEQRQALDDASVLRFAVAHPVLRSGFGTNA